MLIHMINFLMNFIHQAMENSVTATVLSITLSHRTTENEALLRGTLIRVL